MSYTEADLRQLLLEDINAYITGEVSVIDSIVCPELAYLKAHEIDNDWVYIIRGGTPSSSGTIADDTGTIDGDLVSLSEGDNVITVTGLGTLTIALVEGSTCVVLSGEDCLVTGSPLALSEESNSIEVTGATGTITIVYADVYPIIKEYRQVESWTPSTTTLEVVTEFSDDPADGDTFYIFPWTPSQMRRALNNAAVIAGIKIQKTCEGSLSWVSNNYKYSLTASTLTNDTGTAIGSPISLAAGANTIVISATGIFKITLPIGWTGTVDSNALVEGENSVTLTSGTYTLTLTAGLDQKNYFITRIQLKDENDTYWPDLRDWYRRGDDLYFRAEHETGWQFKLWYEYSLPQLTSAEVETWDVTREQALLLITYAQIELFRQDFHRSKADMKEEIKDQIAERQEVLHERYLAAGPVPTTEIARSYLN